MKILPLRGLGRVALLALALAACAPTANQTPAGPPMAAFPLEARSGVRRVTVGLWKPSFSPDGTRLAVGRTGGGIEVVELATGARNKLTLFGLDPAWSPDGRFIAFAGGEKQSAVWVIDAAGGQPRRVADGAFPSWSADGKRLFVVSRPDGQIFQVAIDDAAAKPQLFFGHVNCWYPAVSPDETRVAMGLDGEIIVVQRESGIEVGRVGVGRGGQFVSWSPDGRWVAFGSFDGGGVRLYHPETREIRTVVNGPFTIPTFSRDGRMLAFDQRTHGSSDVWVTDKFDLVPRPRLVRNIGTIGATGVLRLLGKKSAPSWRWRKLPMAELDLKDLSGRTWTLRELEGKVALINVWASWCGPCKKELPVVQKLYDSLKGRADTVVLSLNIDGEPEKGRKYAAENKLTFPVLLASDYVSSVVGPVSIPRNWIVHRGLLTSESSGYEDGQEEAWLKEARAQIEKARAAR